MSGPCTDCGGPDYQTLEARIAELEAGAGTSICIFCGATMAKDLAVMLAHAGECKKRPENRLMERIAELEAETAEEKRLHHVAEVEAGKMILTYNRAKRAAEAELDEARWTIDEMSDHLDPAIKDIDKFWKELDDLWVERSTS